VDLVNRAILRVATGGGAIVIATHDFIAGEAVTSRVVTLQNGQLDTTWSSAGRSVSGRQRDRSNSASLGNSATEVGR
jgi:hypothetical protein